MALCAATVVALAAGTVWHARRPAWDGPVRHVIVISLDTTRVDHFGCYGNTWIRTPRMDALAAESILFTDYMTVVSTTLASHTSLFSGKYPHTHGVPRNGFVVHDDNVMLTEILREAGFRTVGFLGSFALDKRFNFAQGFGHYDETFSMLADGRGVDQNQRRAKAVTDAVIGYLDRQSVPRNLFLFVHYFDPHRPYDPPPPYNAMYGPAARAIELEDHPALLGGAPEDVPMDRLRNYAGEVSYMDYHVGRLLDDLKQRGILDNAMLIVTSDHGEDLGDMATGQLKPSHGWSTHEVEMRALCLIRLPEGASGGTRLDLPVASIDVLPTLTNYLGLPSPAGVEGEVIDLEHPDRNVLSRVRFAEATKPSEEAGTDPRWFNNALPQCVREGPYKYTRTVYQRCEGLYDLSTDPYERTNLLLSPTVEISALAAELRHKLNTWAAAAKPLPTHFDRGQEDETIRRLTALGYLEKRSDENDAEEPPP